MQNILKSRILKAAMFTVYAAAFGEAFVRLTDPQPILPRYVTATDYGIRGNIPNARYWHVTPEVNVEMRINAEGMRSDREYAFEKPPATCRVALFGDSYFMGYELDIKDTFATRLEEELRRQGANAEVLNFAVSGFGTSEMIRKYEFDARRYNPDIVIFQLHETDANDNLRADLFDYKDGKVTPTERQYLPATGAQELLLKIPFYQFIADHSQLYSLVRERLSAAIRIQMAALKEYFAGQSPAGGAEITPASGQPDFGIMLTRALFDYASQELASEGREFYVADVPTFYFRTKFGSAADMLTPDQQTRMNLFSPYAQMVKLADGETRIYYEKGHRHLTPLGVNVLVSAAMDKLAGSKALQGCKK